jgi:hypothetical protein
MERSRQNTTKTASPAATIIICSRICLIDQQLKFRKKTCKKWARHGKGRGRQKGEAAGGMGAPARIQARRPDRAMVKAATVWGRRRG